MPPACRRIPFQGAVAQISSVFLCQKMRTVRVTRYISDCGRGFWTKKTAETHDKNCRCWTNPKFKTCKTCAFCTVENDSNGMEHDPKYLQTWASIECHNPDFDYDKHFTEAHGKAPDLCINCPVWKNKNNKN